VNQSTDPNESRYDKNGIWIEVVFRDKVAARIKFSVKSDKMFGEKLTDGQVFDLLKANEAGSNWQMVNRDAQGKRFVRADGTAVAEWDYEDGSLVLMTAAEKKIEEDLQEVIRSRAEAERKAKADALKNSTKGF
jgi:hypothetical protein